MLESLVMSLGKKRSTNQSNPTCILFLVKALVIYERKKTKLVKNNLESSEISSAEWLSLNQFLYEVKQIDSKCVSVYYPYGKGQETISLLQETKRKEPFEIIESKT